MINWKYFLTKRKRRRRGYIIYDDIFQKKTEKIMIYYLQREVLKVPKPRVILGKWANCFVGPDLRRTAYYEVRKHVPDSFLGILVINFTALYLGYNNNVTNTHRRETATVWSKIGQRDRTPLTYGKLLMNNVSVIILQSAIV